MPGMPMALGAISTLLKFATPRRFNDPDYARDIAGECYGGAMRDPDAWEGYDGCKTSRLGYLFQQLALVGWSSHLWLPLLRQPTLILAGDDDPIVPVGNAKLMAMLIPNARLHTLPDGHHFFRSRLGETSAAMQEFLDAK
jgi:pimeloyl-ACP methyl ester carboxylesterase